MEIDDLVHEGGARRWMRGGEGEGGGRGGGGKGGKEERKRGHKLLTK